SLRGVGLGPEARHERVPPEPLDDLVDRRGRGSGALALHLVELQRVAVPAQRIKFRDFEQQVPLSATRPPFQRQAQSEAVEQVDENRLARANPAPPLELPIDPGERDRVVQRVMRRAAAVPEPKGRVSRLAAAAERGRASGRGSEKGGVAIPARSAGGPGRTGTAKWLPVVA